MRITEPIQMAPQRLAVCRLFLALLRVSYPPFHNGDDGPGANCDNAVLMGAIALGQLERRPMNASKLSAFAGIARATATRRLHAMEAEGVVIRTAGGYVLPVDAMNHPAVLAATLKCTRLIRDAAAELSKLDT